MMRLLVAFCLLVLPSIVRAQPPRPGFPPPGPKLPPGTKPPGVAPSLPDAPPDIPQLLKLLSSKNEADRLEAAERIQGFGQAALGALDGLIRSTDDSNDFVRLAALEAIGGLRADGRKGLPEIRQRLQKAKSDYERVLAARALLRISTDASDVALALPVLAQGLQSEDDQVAVEAANTLRELGGPAVATLVAALEGTPRVRRLAVDALGQIGASAKDAVPAITNLLSINDPETTAAAATALGHIGVRAPETIRALAKSASSADESVARASIRALTELRLNSPSWIPFLTKQLAEGRPSVRAEAMSALAEQGEAAVPALTAALQDPRSQYWAVLVLGEIGPAAKDAVPALANALDTAAPDARIEILLTLAKLGPASAPAAEKIAKQLGDKHDGVRYAATLAALGTGGKALDATLQQNATSQDSFLAMLSAVVYAVLHPQDSAAGQRAMSLLTAGLNSRDAHVQRAAKHVLEQLRPKPAK